MLAALKSIMEADKIKSLLPNFTDIVSDYVRRMHEEEKARQEQVLRGGIYKTAADYAMEQLGLVSATDAIVDALKLHDRDYLSSVL